MADLRLPSSIIDKRQVPVFTLDPTGTICRLLYLQVFSPNVLLPEATTTWPEQGDCRVRYPRFWSGSCVCDSGRVGGSGVPGVQFPNSTSPACPGQLAVQRRLALRGRIALRVQRRLALRGRI